MVKTRVIRLRVIEDPNSRDQMRCVHCIHSLWKSKQMLTTHTYRMRTNNLKIRIAGSSRHQQLPQISITEPWETSRLKTKQ